VGEGGGVGGGGGDGVEVKVEVKTEIVLIVEKVDCGRDKGKVGMVVMIVKGWRQ
jgi:hypothetical protein